MPGEGEPSGEEDEAGSEGSARKGRDEIDGRKGKAGRENGRKRRKEGEEERRRSRDERPQSTQHRLAKIAWNTPGIYYPLGCSCRRRPPLGQEVAGSGTDTARRKRSVPSITKSSRGFTVAFAGIESNAKDHPELFVCTND